MPGKYDLTANELLLLQSEMRREEKSLGVAYLMLLGGHLGLHRFYIGQKQSAIAQLVLFVFCIVCYIGLIVAGVIAGSKEEASWLPFPTIMLIAGAIALSVWVIVDLFLLPRLVREYNEAREQEAIAAIMAMRQRNGTT